LEKVSQSAEKKELPIIQPIDSTGAQGRTAHFAVNILIHQHFFEFGDPANTNKPTNDSMTGRRQRRRLLTIGCTRRRTYQLQGPPLLDAVAGLSRILLGFIFGPELGFTQCRDKSHIASSAAPSCMNWFGPNRLGRLPGPWAYPT
jgi:hypothetical protein